MKVFIDDLPLRGDDKFRGVGEYTRNLIDALKALSKRKDLVLVNKDYDIVHYPYFHLFFNTLPLYKNTKTIVTIHDVIPLLYPKNYPPGIRGKVSFWKQKISLKTVNAIITDTQTSKKDIVRLLDVPQAKIFPIYLAPAACFKRLPDNSKILKDVQKRYSLPEKFVLYVGDVNYNKNVATLVKACQAVGVPLVIVGKHALEIDELGYALDVLRGPSDWLRFLLGKPHPELAHYQDLLGALEKNKQVFRLGFVPIGDLVAIYNLATVYCQPSFYEGFGLPPLEAMACGLPTIVSKTQALIEISADSTLSFDPKDVSGLVEVLRKVLNNKNLQTKLSSEGLRHVKNFSWNLTAKKTFEVYKKVYVQN